MAEIKIEKQKTIWPWILLGILLLALLLYFLVFRNDNNADDTVTTTGQDTTGTAGRETGGPVADYLAFVNGDGSMGLDHAYTNSGLVHLANAIQAKANQVGYDVKADLGRVKDLAGHITQDPAATTHADSIRNAAGILATALQNMQQAKFPDLNNEAGEVKQAAGDIDPDVLTLEQRGEVKSFFNKAAQVLQKMN